MARVYFDTSFVSACVTTRDDPASIVRRQTSSEWLSTQQHLHSVFVSAEVINELDNAAFSHRDAALQLVSDLPLLELNEDAFGLAAAFIAHKLMPGPVSGDALHVAACCVHNMEYLLSWNVRHLANPRKVDHPRIICTRLGLVPPAIVTPDLLWEDPE